MGDRNTRLSKQSLERRRRKGAEAFQWGAAAERLAASKYESMGAEILAMRERNEAGETDLILRHGEVIVFTEVKARRSIDEALRATSPASWRRKGEAALLYASKVGHLGDIRLDLAAVDRNGEVVIVENAGMSASY